MCKKKRTEEEKLARRAKRDAFLTRLADEFKNFREKSHVALARGMNREHKREVSK